MSSPITTLVNLYSTLNMEFDIVAADTLYNHTRITKDPTLGKEICNGGLAFGCLQLGSLEKTVGASFIALWFVLRQSFFVERMMAHVMLVNHCRQKVV